MLDLVANAHISIDFVKLTPSGLSFIIPESKEGAVNPSFPRFSSAIKRASRIFLFGPVAASSWCMR